MSRTERRKKLLVDRHVQGTIVRQLILHWLTACLVVAIYLLILQMLSSEMGQSLGDRLSAMWRNNAAVLVVLITLIPVFIFDTVRVSHRFAGPMVSFRKSLKQLADGESIKPIVFRDGDYWNDMADHLNHVAQRLGQIQNSSEPTRVGS